MPQVTNSQIQNNPMYGAVGLVSATFGNGTGFGSGALIDGTHVLTCAHNFYSLQTQAAATSALFSPGYNQSLGDPPTAPTGVVASRVFMPAAFTNDNDVSWDVAVARLDQVQTIPATFVPTPAQGFVRQGSELYLIGYPENRLGEMWIDQDEVATLDWERNFLVYTHDTMRGTSGGPLAQYDAISNEIRLFAVHVRGPSAPAQQVQAAAPPDNNLRVGILMTGPVLAFVDWALQAQPADGNFIQLY